MTINLEQIDELRKRTNASYEDAKKSLEECNGDMVEALIYLEKHKKIKPEEKTATDNFGDFILGVKRIIKKGNQTKFIIKKGDSIILSLPVTIVVIVTVIAPYITVLALILAILTGHRIKFQGKNGEDMKVNETLDKVSDSVVNLKKKLVEDDVKATPPTN
ncbi:MAG: DUF4342 domain-containing protein [Clostridiaceae bacterium]|nr:DUF4342 domain-containing protein [Clostridiaceae bacterium]